MKKMKQETLTTIRRMRKRRNKKKLKRNLSCKNNKKRKRKEKMMSMTKMHIMKRTMMKKGSTSGEMKVQTGIGIIMKIRSLLNAGTLSIQDFLILKKDPIKEKI